MTFGELIFCVVLAIAVSLVLFIEQQRPIEIYINKDDIREVIEGYAISHTERTQEEQATQDKKTSKRKEIKIR